MGHLVKPESGLKIDVSGWEELDNYLYGKGGKIKNPDLSLQEFFENKFGSDLEKVLTTGNILYNHLKKKTEAKIKIKFLCRLKKGFRYCDLEESHYLFSCTDHCDSAQDSAVITNVYSILFRSTRQPLEIHRWESELQKFDNFSS